MDLNYFPHFIRRNYPDLARESNEVLIAFGEEFKKYLEEVFKDKMDKLEPIWDISPNSVVKKSMERDMLYMNGYHCALIIHVGEFADKMKKEAEQEQKNEPETE